MTLMMMLTIIIKNTISPLQSSCNAVGKICSHCCWHFQSRIQLCSGGEAAIEEAVWSPLGPLLDMEATRA